MYKQLSLLCMYVCVCVSVYSSFPISFPSLLSLSLPSLFLSLPGIVMVTETGTTEVVMIPTVLQVKNLAELAIRESLLVNYCDLVTHIWIRMGTMLKHVRF